MRWRIYWSCFVLVIWIGLAGISPASAAPGATIVGISTNVLKCTSDVAIRVKDAGDYFINMWDDGNFRAGAGGPVATDGMVRVRFTIGGPILEGAAGIGIYAENGLGPGATTTYDSMGSASPWSPALGNSCQAQGYTFGASIVSEDFPKGTKFTLTASLGATKPRTLSLLSKDNRIALGRGPSSPDDPVANGGQLRVMAEGGTAFDNTYILPAGNWVYLSAADPSKGYLFVGNNEIQTVLVQSGKKIKIDAKSDLLGHSLTAGPDAVIVELRVGERRYCYRFGGETTFVQDRSYAAKAAPPDELACPD